MDKKFALQIVILLIVIFGGLFSIFQPQSLGIPSVLPGGGTINNTNNNQPLSGLAKAQILIIDSQSTGNPELVKSIITVDVADEPTERAQGLSNRENMPENEGMIFLFPEPNKYNFIMKQMRFPLDFIWVRDNVVVDVLENIQPDPPETADVNLRRYAPVSEVNAVIEVNAGYINKHGIKVGDRIRIEQLAN